MGSRARTPRRAGHGRSATAGRLGKQRRQQGRLLLTGVRHAKRSDRNSRSTCHRITDQDPGHVLPGGTSNWLQSLSPFSWRAGPAFLNIDPEDLVVVVPNLAIRSDGVGIDLRCDLPALGPLQQVRAIDLDQRGDVGRQRGDLERSRQGSDTQLSAGLPEELGGSRQLSLPWDSSE